MASIERTAYPRFSPYITAYELAIFTPSTEEIAFCKKNTVNNNSLLCLTTLLKCFQYLGYFPIFSDIPKKIVSQIRQILTINESITLEINQSTLYLHYEKIRQYLKVKIYSVKAEKLIIELMTNLIHDKNNPIDLINASIEALVCHHFELPAYSHLHNLAMTIRERVNDGFYKRIIHNISAEFRKQYDIFLISINGQETTFERIKSIPPNPTLTHLKEWIDHLNWLMSLGDVESFLQGISLQKRRSFAEMAKILDAGEMKDLKEGKRYSLMICLLWQVRRNVRDQLLEMFLRRMKVIENKAKDKLSQIIVDTQELNQELIQILQEVALAYEEGSQESLLAGTFVKNVIDQHGGVKDILEKCSKASAILSKSHFSLIWQFFKSHRKAMFTLLKEFDFYSTTEDKSLIDAIDIVIANENSRSRYIPISISLAFASQKWKTLIELKHKGKTVLSRRDLECCVFYYLSRHLHAGDVVISQSEQFCDYREDLLTWEECLPLLDSYCDQLHLSTDADTFVNTLKQQLTEKAEMVDRTFPENDAIRLNNKGELQLTKYKAEKLSSETKNILQAISNNMPERKILDLLASVQNSTNFTRHFVPPTDGDGRM